MMKIEARPQGLPALGPGELIAQLEFVGGLPARKATSGTCVVETGDKNRFQNIGMRVQGLDADGGGLNRRFAAIHAGNSENVLHAARERNIGLVHHGTAQQADEFQYRVVIAAFDGLGRSGRLARGPEIVVLLLRLVVIAR